MGFFALISPSVAGLFGTRAHGTLFGIVSFSGTVGGAIGSLLAGYIFDITHSYRLGFLLLIMLSIIGLMLTASLNPITGGGGQKESQHQKWQSQAKEDIFMSEGFCIKSLIA